MSGPDDRLAGVGDLASRRGGPRATGTSTRLLPAAAVLLAAQAVADSALPR